MKPILEYLKRRDKQAYGLKELSFQSIMDTLEENGYEELTINHQYETLGEVFKKSERKSYIMRSVTDAIFVYIYNPDKSVTNCMGLIFDKTTYKIERYVTGNIESSQDFITWNKDKDKRSPKEIIDNFFEQ